VESLGNTFADVLQFNQEFGGSLLHIFCNDNMMPWFIDDCVVMDQGMWDHWF